jgi:hypothetical protein
MKFKCYLIFNEGGAVRATKRVPSLAAGELAIPLVVSVPAEAFYRLAPAVELTVFESAVLRPAVSVEVEEPKL